MKGSAPPPGNAPTADFAAVLARWGLGIVFIYMGWNKALDPVSFLKFVGQYEVVTQPLLLNLIASMLPWFEIVCGCLLLAGVAVHGSSLMVALMLVPFSILVARRALMISAEKGIPFLDVRFNCGCGGGEILIWHKLIENAVLLGLSIWLLAGCGRKLSLRYDLFATAR